MFNRGFLLSLLAAVLLLAVPQGASALKFDPAAGNPITDSGNPINMSAPGDFNGDGRDDIAFGISGVNGFKVKLAQADGTFADAGAGGQAFGTGPAVGSVDGIRVADVNGDGDLDVLVTVMSRNWQIYLGDGTGQFGLNPDSTFAVPYTEAPRYMQPAGTYSATITDLDDDGDLDIAVGMYDFAFAVILGDGSGNFTPQPITYFADQATRGQFDGFASVAAGDFNGDGDVDLALGMRRDGSVAAATGVYTATGNGDGTFTPNPGAPLLTQPFAPTSIAAIDLNGDSFDDLAVSFFNTSGEPDDDLFTLLGSAGGLTTNGAADGSLDGGYALYQMSTADLDDDGLSDLIVGVRGDRELALIRNHGDGTITPFAGSPVALDPIDGKQFAANAVYGGDFNGDDVTDLASDASHSGDPNQARGIHVLISQPDAAPSPSSLDFDLVVPGQASAQQPVTITNTGAAPALPAGAVTITGTDADQFTLGTSNCSGGGQIPAGGSCTVGVIFAPASNGEKEATLHYAMSNQDDISVPLAGVAGSPGLTVPSGISYLGQTFLGDTASITVTLESTGDAPLTIGTPFVKDIPGQSEFFSIADDGCAGQTMAPGGTCTLKVEYTPTAAGSRGTLIGIPSNDAGSATKHFEVNGVGIDPGISVSPESEDFGSVEIGFFGAPQTRAFTINSTGTTNLSASPITITGTNSGDFSFVGTPNCGPIAPGHACPVQVRFSPQPGSTGSRTANLVIENNTRNDDPVTIPLTGTATAAHVTPAPSVIDFGDVDPYDGTTTTRTLELKSDGTADLRAIAHFGTFSGGTPEFSAGPFSVNGDACYGTTADPVVTPPVESCVLTVTFDTAKATAGSNEETLHVVTNGNAIDLPLSANLTEGGVTVDSETVEIGEVEIGQTGSATLTLNSTGTAPLRLGDPELSGPDAGMFSVEQPSSCPGLAAGQTCAVEVSFAPGSVGSKQAELMLSGNFGSLAIALSGKGIKAVKSPARVSLRLSGPRKVKRGKKLALTARVMKTGEAASGPLTLRVKVPKKLAKRVKPIRISSIGAGTRTVTRKIGVRVKKSARKGAKLIVKVKLSGPGVKAVSGKREARLR